MNSATGFAFRRRTSQCAGVAVLNMTGGVDDTCFDWLNTVSVRQFRQCGSRCLSGNKAQTPSLAGCRAVPSKNSWPSGSEGPGGVVLRPGNSRVFGTPTRQILGSVEEMVFGLCAPAGRWLSAFVSTEAFANAYEARSAPDTTSTAALLRRSADPAQPGRQGVRRFMNVAQSRIPCGFWSFDDDISVRGCNRPAD